MDIDLDIELNTDLDIKMQALNVNDNSFQNDENNMYNMYGTDDIDDENVEDNEEVLEITDTIISDMQKLSIDEKQELMYDLFDNNLDIYSFYSDLQDGIKSKKDPTEYNTDLKLLSNKYDIQRIIGFYGIPNEYCNGEDFDDEDFIYNRFKLSEHLSYLVKNDNTVQELDNGIINFSDNIISPENVYYKILYIYQFVHYFNTSLSTLKIKKRIMHLPQEFLLWVDNIVSIIKNTINITDMHTSLCVYQNEKNSINDIMSNLKSYFKDLVYGMSLCICHLKMILNHHRIRKIHFWDMEEKYIEKFFRILNNLCIIVIYMKHGL